MKNQLACLLRGTYSKNRFADGNTLRGVVLSLRIRARKTLLVNETLLARRARRHDAGITLINDTVLLAMRSKNAQRRAVKSACMPQGVEARELLAAFGAGTGAVFVREDVVEPPRIWELVEGKNEKRGKKCAAVFVSRCLALSTV